jgi:hypothetical protein
MTATNHVVTGAVIGAAVGQPWLALPLAFASHFAMDALPHYGVSDHKSKKFLYSLFIDMGLASGFLLSILLMQPQHWPLLLACAVAAASPDLNHLPNWLRELKNKPLKQGRIAYWSARIQWCERDWGIAVELVWFASMLAIFIKLTSPVA